MPQTSEASGSGISTVWMRRLVIVIQLIWTKSMTQQFPWRAFCTANLWQDYCGKRSKGHQWQCYKKTMKKYNRRTSRLRKISHRLSISFFGAAPKGQRQLTINPSKRRQTCFKEITVPHRKGKSLTALNTVSVSYML